jgi:hypothetical protein
MPGRCGLATIPGRDERCGEASVRWISGSDKAGSKGYARGNRPGFLSLMRAIAAREFDVIVVRDVDRMAPGPDLPVICREIEFAQVLLLGMDKTDSRDASFRMGCGSYRACCGAQTKSWRSLRAERRTQPFSHEG